MDSDDVLALCFLTTILLLPIATGLAVTSYVAYSRTKKWDKDRTLKAASIESSTLLTSEDPEESDFYDTDDEAEHDARKAEEEADKYLTFNQMWRKEFRNVWNGKGAKQVIKEREREERRKLAKAVARELERRERRRARKVEGEGLPAYKK
jgi:hypothetical protein